VSPSDLAKKRGKGPKPKEERRKRVKKEVVKEIPHGVIPQPYVEQFKWRTSRSPPGERNVGRSKPTQPIDMSFAETVLSGRGVRLSAPIPQDSFSMEEEEESKPSRADPENEQGKENERRDKDGRSRR